MKMRPEATSISVGLAMVFALSAAPVALGSSHESDAADYCSSQGGQVVELKPALYPDTDDQVELGGKLEVCQFISGSDDGSGSTMLVVDLTTLYSEDPTLAGLAYLSTVPFSSSGAAGSNPAASYCPDDLAGTEAFGTAATGAWIGALDPGMEAGDPSEITNMVTLCVFADRSAIDDFGVFYASDGTIRGVDLASVMRYQPDGDVPEIFATDG